MKTSSRLRKNTEKYRKTKMGFLTNLYHKMKNRKGVDFSLAYFKEHLLHYWKFNYLFNQWAKSGATKLRAILNYK